MNKNLENWKQANTLYQELIHLSTSEALQKLGELQASESVKSLVLKLIESAETTSSFIEDEVADLKKSLFSQAHKAGDTIDQYKLIEEIGQGGMSRVYKAVRLNTENQKPVAIKIFNAGEGNKKLLDLFFAEQKILAELTHPNIISMHHGGTTEDGISYLAMELLESAVPIDTYVSKKNLSTQKKVKLINKAARAISYAHAQLVIHRDIKPSNIIINQQGELKVVDFGIAKLLSNEKPQDLNQTILALTPNFASPEQVKSKGISVTTDVFSLAVVLLTLITGGSPFSKTRMLEKCKNDEAEINQALKNKEIDKDLKNILNKALKASPQERYVSMDHFAEDLMAWLQQKPVSATPDSLYYQISKFAKRRRGVFVSVSALMITMILSIALLLWQNNKVRIEAEKARQVKDFMLNTFENTDPDITKGQKVSANDLLMAAAERIESDVEMNQEIRSELIESIGIAFGKLGLYDEAIKYLNQSLEANPEHISTISYLAENFFNAKRFEELEDLLRHQKIKTNEANNDTFRVLQIKARYEARNTQFDQALKTVEDLKSLGLKDLEHQIAIQRLLAEVYFYQSPTNKSVEIIDSILKRPELEKNQSLVFELRKELAEYLIQIGNHDRALTELESLYEDQSKLLGENHPSLLETLRVQSATLKDMSQFDQAQKISEKAYEISQQHFGENSVPSGYVLNNLAVIAHQLGDVQKAEDLLEKAVGIFDRELPQEYSDSLELKSNYAATLYSNKKYKEALNIIKQIYKIQAKNLGETHNQTLYTQKLWAETLGKLGYEQSSIEMIEQVYAKALENLGLDNPVTQQIIYSKGIIYQTYNRFEKASEAYRQIMATETDPPSPLIRKASRRLALVLIPLGEEDEVIKYFEKTISLSDKALGEKHSISLDSLKYYIEFLIDTERQEEAKLKLSEFESRVEGNGNRKEQWQQLFERLK